MRAVVDPNVLVSGLIASGPPAVIVDASREGRFELVTSPNLFEELDEVLRRPKFRRYVSPAEVDGFLDALRERALLVDDPPEAEVPLTPDPRDDYLVALTRVAHADYLVSGDPDLLELSDPHPLALSPRAFLDRLGLGGRSVRSSRSSRRRSKKPA